MKKVVVLNSGGFDSVTLLHYLDRVLEDTEIHSLFFSYGQLNEYNERHWAEYHAAQISAVHNEIALPKFDWTHSKFFEEGYEYKSQEVEWRNLIFLSYAMSYAAAVGADTIYLALLKDGGYKDTTVSFINKVNAISNDVEISAPFIKKGKSNVTALAFVLGIKPNEFSSCDSPVKVKRITKEFLRPCGECDKCKSIEQINKHLKMDSVFKCYSRANGDVGSLIFKAGIKVVKPTHFRVYWNDKCQLNCKHCYIGKSFNSPALSLEEFVDATRQAIEYGMNDIAIIGKEPLFDDSVIEYIRRIKAIKNDVQLSLISNGINVPFYAEALKKAGLDSISISMNIGEDDIRPTEDIISINAIKAAIKSGLKPSVILTPYRNNYLSLSAKFQMIEDLGVSNIHVGTIMNVGNSAENKLAQLGADDLCNICTVIEEYKPKNKNTQINLTLGITDVGKIQTAGVDKYRKLISLEKFITVDKIAVNKYFFISAEFCCNAYLNHILLTHDGYILGCAMERPLKYTVGNIREHSLSELIEKGREINLKRNGKSLIKCPFEK